MNYQDGIVGKGERECFERWEMIRDELITPGITLDIGSAEGFFCKKIVEEKNMMAIAVESNQDCIQRQMSWIKQGRYEGRLITCSVNINNDLLKKMSTVCDFYENVLLLSVLHWMPNPGEFIKLLSSISGKVFVELPHYDDHKACGRKNIEIFGKDQKAWLEQNSGRQVRLIGNPRAHTSEFRNMWVIEGQLERHPTLPFIGCNPTEKKEYTEKWDEKTLEFVKKGKRQAWVPGVNVNTLKWMKIVFPLRRWWECEINKALSKIANGKHPDKCIHNIIASYNEVRWIDFDPRHITVDFLVRDLSNFSV